MSIKFFFESHFFTVIKYVIFLYILHCVYLLLLNLVCSLYIYFFLVSLTRTSHQPRKNHDKITKLNLVYIPTNVNYQPKPRVILYWKAISGYASLIKKKSRDQYTANLKL